MYELLLQDSYAEWIVPITLVILWIFRWHLFTVFQSVQSNGSEGDKRHFDIFSAPLIHEEPLPAQHHQFYRLVRRKLSPDDDEGPLFLFKKDQTTF